MWPAEKMGMMMKLLLLLFTASILPTQTEADLTIPGLSGTANGSCANVDCQKGTCSPNTGSIIDLVAPYKCECDPGWTSFLSFFPCNIPNCTLNFSCTGSSAPAPSSPPLTPTTNACLWPGICGHGKCLTENNASLFSPYTCSCDPGYSNLLNMTGGLCVSNCELGAGCSQLGISLGTPPSGSSNGNGTAAMAPPPNAGTSPSNAATPESSSSGQSSPSPSTGWRHLPLGFFTIGALVITLLLLSLYS